MEPRHDVSWTADADREPESEIEQLLDDLTGGALGWS